MQFKFLEDLFAAVGAVGDVAVDILEAFISDYGVKFTAGKQTLTPAWPLNSYAPLNPVIKKVDGLGSTFS